MLRFAKARTLAWKLRYGFRGAPVFLAGERFRLDESLRRWQIGAEQEVHNAIGRSLQVGDVFVDIGANFGLHSLLAARSVGEIGRVIAFEPVPHNVWLLHQNVRLNHFQNRVQIVAAAVSNSPLATIVLDIPENGCAVTAMIDNDGAGHGTAVSNVRLDDFQFACGQSPTLIKIDVEGAELEVLRGASELLERLHPQLLIEIHPRLLPRFDGSFDEIDGLLINLGYRGGEISAAGCDETFHMLYAK